MPKYINPYTDFLHKERDDYERSRLSYIGFKQATDTARKDGIEEGIAKGFEEGIAKGIEKGKSDAIIGLYENGIPVEVIAKSLQISEEKASEIIFIHTKK